jgi:hypothetical protein
LRGMFRFIVDFLCRGLLFRAACMAAVALPMALLVMSSTELQFRDYVRARNYGPHSLTSAPGESPSDVQRGKLFPNQCLLDCAPSCGNPGSEGNDCNGRTLCSNNCENHFCIFGKEEFNAYDANILTDHPDCRAELETCLPKCRCSAEALVATYAMNITMGASVWGSWVVVWVLFVLLRSMQALLALCCPRAMRGRVVDVEQITHVWFLVCCLSVVAAPATGWIVRTLYDTDAERCSNHVATSVMQLTWMTTGDLGAVGLIAFVSSHGGPT